MDQNLVFSIVVYLIVFWVGFRFGHASAIVKIAKEVASQINAAIDEEDLKIEKHGSLYFAYGNEHRFLSQGATFFELLTNLKTRFPGKDFKIKKKQEHLTDEEVGRMITAIFDVFGNDKDDDAQHKQA